MRVKGSFDPYSNSGSVGLLTCQKGSMSWAWTSPLGKSSSLLLNRRSYRKFYKRQMIALVVAIDFCKGTYLSKMKGKGSFDPYKNSFSVGLIGNTSWV